MGPPGLRFFNPQIHTELPTIDPYKRSISFLKLKFTIMPAHPLRGPREIHMMTDCTFPCF